MGAAAAGAWRASLACVIDSYQFEGRGTRCRPVYLVRKKPHRGVPRSTDSPGRLFNLISPLVASVVLAFYGLIFGAVIGAVLGVVMHALQRGRRDFDAVTMMVPSRFEVVVDEEVAAEAARLLAEAPAVPTQTTAG